MLSSRQLVSCLDNKCNPWMWYNLDFVFHLSRGQAASATFAVGIFVLDKQNICLSV